MTKLFNINFFSFACVCLNVFYLGLCSTKKIVPHSKIKSMQGETKMKVKNVEGLK
jgi:hypothetical protein